MGYRTMSKLETLRKLIDDIDEEIVYAIDRRCDLAKQAAITKAEEGLPSEDKERETLVTRTAIARSRVLCPSGVTAIFRAIIAAVKTEQMDVRSHLAAHRVTLGNVTLGHEPFVFAGPCTIDPNNPSLTIETAHAVKEAGANALRGGVWKPRTNPNSYQGDPRALSVLLEAGRAAGLPVNTEVMDEVQVRLAIDAGVDCLQVGARNALNYSLLRQIGQAIAGRPVVVLLKRSLHMGTCREFIAAAEYIVQLGNPNVILCPRGTKPGLDGYRNHPDESIVPLLKELTWAPVVVDTSHSVGKAAYVRSASLAAIAYGADGLCIECNIQPDKGIGDDPKQAVTPELLKQIIAECRQLWSIRNGS